MLYEPAHSSRHVEHVHSCEHVQVSGCSMSDCSLLSCWACGAQGRVLMLMAYKDDTVVQPTKPFVAAAGAFQVCIYLYRRSR